MSVYLGHVARQHVRLFCDQLIVRASHIHGACPVYHAFVSIVVSTVPNNCIPQLNIYPPATSFF